jgi:hypothetical protein
MTAPKPALTPAQAWLGKDISVCLLGRRFLNGPRLKELHKVTLTRVEAAADLADVVTVCMGAVLPDMTMPADNIEHILITIPRETKP